MSKSRKATAVATVAPASVPVAPAHPGGTGKSVKGGHHNAWRAQKDFALTDKVSMAQQVNPWRKGSLGEAFCNQVLLRNPGTVQGCIELAGKMPPPVTPKQTQKHLRWAFTWPVAGLLINGKLFSQS